MTVVAMNQAIYRTWYIVYIYIYKNHSTSERQKNSRAQRKKNTRRNKNLERRVPRAVVIHVFSTLEQAYSKAPINRCIDSALPQKRRDTKRRTD